jgi:di/tripeptidase
VSGGTSVNTIAPDAKMAIDIRSDQMEPLLETEKKILTAIDESVTEENRRWNVNTLSAATRLIGDRPGGSTPVDSVLVEAAVRANTHFGNKTLLSGASTDANVPMSWASRRSLSAGAARQEAFTR